MFQLANSHLGSAYTLDQVRQDVDWPCRLRPRVHDLVQNFPHSFAELATARWPGHRPQTAQGCNQGLPQQVLHDTLSCNTFLQLVAQCFATWQVSCDTAEFARCAHLPSMSYRFLGNTAAPSPATRLQGRYTKLVLIGLGVSSVRLNSKSMAG